MRVIAYHLWIWLVLESRISGAWVYLGWFNLKFNYLILDLFIHCPKSFVMLSLLVACSIVLYIDHYNLFFIS